MDGWQMAPDWAPGDQPSLFLVLCIKTFRRTG